MKERYHFIGIGGIGMGALASLLLAKGYNVSGSDLKENELTKDLREMGARIWKGHDPEHVEGADRVIYSSAIPEDNPEYTAARGRNIRLMRRAELLAELMQEHIGITVAGAHGKTTTTSMIAHILLSAGLQPTVALGGMIMGGSSNARLGAGKYFVAEVDESDRSFLKFSPNFSVITNIDLEHVDQYKDWDEVLDTYARFVRCTRKDGLIIACGEDANLMKVLKKEKVPCRTYGFSEECDIHATDIQFFDYSSSFNCYMQGRQIGQIILDLPGRHNVLNALAAIGIATSVGIDFDTIRKAFRTFRGVKRRFQRKGEFHNILLIDDYAHHPTEITSTLLAAQQLKRTRLVTIFQPHRYSRLQALMEDFAKCFTGSDYVIITDIYAASEIPIEGLSAAQLSEKVKETTNKPVVYLKQNDIIEHIKNMTRPGDLIMTLGAGDITELSDRLVSVIETLTFSEDNEEVKKVL